MSTSSKGKAEAGIAHVAVIVLMVFLVATVVAMYFMVRSQANGVKKNQDTSTAEDLPAGSSSSNNGSSSLKVNQRNTARKNDASRLLGAATEYINNNSGQLPTTYRDDALGGGAGSTPSSVSFEMYKIISIVSGTQESLMADELRLVTGAKCDKNGATKTSGSRALAVQFALETTDGSYTYDCTDDQ